MAEVWFGVWNVPSPLPRSTVTVRSDEVGGHEVDAAVTSEVGRDDVPRRGPRRDVFAAAGTSRRPFPKKIETSPVPNWSRPDRHGLRR